MHIGIPNRSSFLHIGAVAQCVAARLLPWSEYHAAKLFYRLPSDDLWSCRCDELCNRFRRGDLEVIFTGDDYAGEYLRGVKYEKVPFAFISVHFALLCIDPGQNRRFDRVFTKYPQTAKEHLKQWDVSYNEINVVSGGSECFACSLPTSAAHDVICTGSTQQLNKLHAVHRGSTLGCSWYFQRGKFPGSLALVTADGNIFSRIRSYYQAVLLSRDMAVRDTIGTLLNLAEQLEQ